MLSSMKCIGASSLVTLAMLALTTTEVHGQSHSMGMRPTRTPRQFHADRTRIQQGRPFFPPRPFGFDPFLRDRLRFDPFLRREFDFDPLLRRRFNFDPFLGIGTFAFPSLAVTPFLFGGLNGF